MNKLILCTLALLLSLSVFAKKDDTVIGGSSNYARSSISIVVINRKDSLDLLIEQAIKSIDYGNRFDINVIPTTSANLATERDNYPSLATINSMITSSKIGHQIVNYWFNGGDSGKIMNTKLIEQRSLLDNNKQANTTRSIKEQGYDLIDNSYVIAVDVCKIEDGEEIIKPTKSVTLTLCVYKIDFAQISQDFFYKNCWIDQNTSQDEINLKRYAFTQMKIPLVSLVSSRAKGTAELSQGGLEEAIETAYHQAMNLLITSIESWKEKIIISQTKPLMAQVKEKVRNTNRFLAYHTITKNERGRISHHRISDGYLRATTNSDKKALENQESSQIKLYQISKLKKIKEEQLIMIDKDLGLSMGLGYNIGNMSDYQFSMDYLTYMLSSGICNYIFFDVGYDMLNASTLQEAGVDVRNSVFNKGFSYLNLSLGTGIGIYLSRFAELVPNVSLGADYMMINAKLSVNDPVYQDQTDSKFTDKLAWYTKYGAKLNINIKYPLQLVLSLDYVDILNQGKYYKINNNFVATGGFEHKDALNYSLGLKYRF